jgi:hypothetical protein
MTVRNLAAAGLALLGLGGPLLVVGLAGRDLPTAGLVGIGMSWLGLLLVLAALLQLGRVEHRMLQAQGRSLGTLASEVRELRSAAADDAFDERLTALTSALEAQLAAQRSDLLRVVDARVLGIHETVRDLGRGERA